MEIKKNTKLIVDITDLGINGEGIAHVGGSTVFVPYALPTEKVETTIIYDKNMLVGKVDKILKSSKDRVEPMCPYFSKCGGCELQHLSYPKTLDFKTKLVKDTLLKVGKIDTYVLPTIKSTPYRYRNKLALPVMCVNGKTILGMFKKYSHTIVPIDDCWLQIDFVRPLIGVIKQFIDKTNITGYNEENHCGILRHVVARMVDNALLVTLVVTTAKIDGLEILTQLLSNTFPNFGLNLCINTKPDNAILDNNIIYVSGIKELSASECGIKYNINALSFMQINDDIKTQIYDYVLANIDEGCTAFDAYSGAGLLSAIVSRKAKQVIGIEIVKEAVKNANEMCVNNQIKNVTNHLGDAGIVLPVLLKENSGVVNVILDPPRKGIDSKVVNALVDNPVDKIIYISCAPSTLARDLVTLTKQYQILSVQPFDMFPNTKHVETVVVLVRRENGTQIN